MRPTLLRTVSCGAAGTALLLSAIAALAASSPPPVPTPLDRPFAGEIHLVVDASDVQRRIVHVHETITGLAADAVLLYPKWLPGEHAPKGPIDRLAGLRITAAGKPVPWSRHTLDVYAVRLRVPTGVKTIDLEFDYLSPTSAKVGEPQVARELLLIEWNDVVLYPAGFYAHQIPVAASLTIPIGWSLATALEPVATDGARTSFGRVPLEQLVDSPVFAGRYVSRIDLDVASGVRLDVFADRPELLEAAPEVIAAHRVLVTQAYRLYGSRHYQHYDFLVALTDQIPLKGLEHHQSTEIISDLNYFLDWEGTPYGRDTLAHEYTHSWNGKFRRPADLWTPNYNVPMQNSLLWVYEGQTEYWGFVLTARAGLWSPEQVRDVWAEIAAHYAVQPGRRWRSLQDTTNDEIINPRRPMSWDSWQRFEEYYDESALFWLEADTLIRERSDGKRSLDDFAKSFFGINDGSLTPVTYTFADGVRALNTVEPYEWSTFLRERLDAIDRAAPLDGLKRGGYHLVYTDKPGDYRKAQESQLKRTLLGYAIGCDIDEKDGSIVSVIWDSAAFKAGLTEGMQILAVNGAAYSGDLLKRTVTAAKRTTTPTVLILKNADRYLVASLDYHGGLRYPHLERDSGSPARLDDILAPRL